ncbi:carbohydrate ABC transporter permease [Paenibacillus sp. tmac-D7]|uniref:carbohydrate ABC transporter permease n=1 Tax=Paenibacillus sp. tmac-D7 TaxID=2591462 RepID=UPI0011432704|nr:sugar ABC transporter permease [Paenibacillus sp. tmac-D7]
MAIADKKWNASLKNRRRFSLPLLIFVSVFTFFGIFYNVYTSFFDWSGIGSRTYIGFDNYVQIFGDPDFFNALKNTFYFLIMTVPASMAVGLLLATLLNGVWIADNLFKSIFFLPHVIAVVTIGTTFAGIYEPNFGLLNHLLQIFGLDSWTHSWLSDPVTSLKSIAAAYIFAHTGFYMLIYYTSMLNMDPEIFEAAKIDGAGVIRQFRHIIFPLLVGTHITLLILGIISALKVFDLVWIMTEGGPGGATELISIYLYRKSMLEFKTGYSAAVSVILLLIAFIYTVFQLNIYNKTRR